MTTLYYRSAEDYLDVLGELEMNNILFYRFDLKDSVVEKIKASYKDISKISMIIIGENKKWFDKDGVKCPIFKFNSPLRELSNLSKEHPYVFVTQCPPYFPYMRKEIRGRIEKLNKAKGDSVLHIVGSNSIMLMHENEIDVMDVNPYKLARVGSIILPNGSQVKKEKFKNQRKWIKLVGFSLKDIQSTKDYTKFNIKSFELASKDRNIMFEADFPKLRKGGGAILREDKKNLEKARARALEVRKLRNEQIYCLDCANKCDLYDKNGICVKKKDFKTLAMMFKTRDPELLRDGLITVLASSAERYHIGRNKEIEDNILMKEVTDIEKNLMKTGIEMLKVLSPELRPVSNKIIMENPYIFAANVVEMMEAQGKKRSEINPEDVLKAITEGEVTEG